MPTSQRRYGVFVFLYAAATVFFHAELNLWLPEPADSPALIAAFAVMLRPTSWRRLLVLLVLQLVHYAQALPDVNTNRTLQAITSLTMLAGLAAAWRSKNGELRLVSWLRSVETPLRIELAIVYFYAFFQKLNWDFLNPELSCGQTLFEQLSRGVERATFGLVHLPHNELAQFFSIHGTLLLEAALPVMLLVPRLRVWAFLIGVPFHGLLGVGFFFGFSATMTALLFLSAPPAFSEKLADLLDDLSTLPVVGSLIREERIRLAAVAACALVSVMIPEYVVKRGLWWLWCLLSLLIASTFAYWVARRDVRLFAGPPPFPRAASAAWIFPLLTFLNGLNPYLGLKTEYSFAMYSNLRTERGHTNHVLGDLVFYLGDYQSRMARVLETDIQSIQYLVKTGDYVPLTELRRVVLNERDLGQTGIRIVYEVDGERRETSAAETDPILAQPMTLLERKLLRFRAVPDGPNDCRH